MSCACASVLRKLEKCLVNFFKFNRQIQNGVHWGGPLWTKEKLREKKALTDRNEYLKEWNNTHKRIYLKARIFHAWLQAKFDAGYEACSDSDFALYCKHFRIYKYLLIRKFFLTGKY